MKRTIISLTHKDKSTAVFKVWGAPEDVERTILENFMTRGVTSLAVADGLVDGEEKEVTILIFKDDIAYIRLAEWEKDNE